MTPAIRPKACSEMGQTNVFCVFVCAFSMVSGRSCHISASHHPPSDSFACPTLSPVHTLIASTSPCPPPFFSFVQMRF
uniref:Secreted protein n=1 Tax=Mesocestoides corti TaxID=53468 RepID=A0A5K3F6Y3_MESCO